LRSGKKFGSLRSIDVADNFLTARLKQTARAGANRAMALFSATSDGEALSYGWLMPGCTLSIVAGVGNGHTAELAVMVIGQSWGPAKDYLSADAGPVEPLIGRIVNVVSTVTAGASSPSPPPPPLVTVTLFQQSPQAPGQRLVLETLTVNGTFGAGNVCRLDFGILLK
jgi:hypothetical protein